MVGSIVFRVTQDGFWPILVRRPRLSRLRYRAEAAVFCLIGLGYIKPQTVVETFLTIDNLYVLVVDGRRRYLVRVP